MASRRDRTHRTLRRTPHRHRHGRLGRQRSRLPGPYRCVSYTVVTQAAPLAPADRFALIIAELCRAVAAHGAGRGWAGPFIILIWRRLRRMSTRFTRLAGRIQTGPRPAPRARIRRARPCRPDRTPRTPRGFAWLIRQVPQTAGGASQLQYLLAEPEMAALIAAAPQAGRILRPLCRMLGIRPPPGLRAPPPAPRAAPPRAEPRTAPPATPHEPPDRPPPLAPPAIPTPPNRA